MEQNLKIHIPNKKNGWIYGTLRGSLQKPLIIFVHGLTGYKDEHPFFNGARFFEKHGFSSFRFNLYDWRKGSRTLIDCALSTHAEDLDTVVAAFHRKGAKNIIVVGHSFGGLTILLSKKQAFDAAVLWDPSNKFPVLTRYIKELDAYDERWHVDVIMGRAMHEEIKNMKWNQLTPNFHVPLKIIAAGKGALVPGCKRYFTQANNPKALAVLPGATHCFDEDGIEEKLFAETLAWCRKYGRDQV